MTHGKRGPEKVSIDRAAIVAVLSSVGVSDEDLLQLVEELLPGKSKFQNTALEHWRTVAIDQEFLVKKSPVYELNFSALRRVHSFLIPSTLLLAALKIWNPHVENWSAKVKVAVSGRDMSSRSDFYSLGAATFADQIVDDLYELLKSQQTYCGCAWGRTLWAVAKRLVRKQPTESNLLPQFFPLWGAPIPMGKGKVPYPAQFTSSNIAALLQSWSRNSEPIADLGLVPGFVPNSIASKDVPCAAPEGR